MLRDFASDLAYRLRALFNKAAVERDLDDELRAHLDIETDRLVRNGTLPEEARRQARVGLGGVEHVKELTRDAHGVRFLERWAQDTRWALRSLRRNAAHIAIVISMLGLAIGANTAIFTAVDALLLRPLAVRSPNALVTLSADYPGLGGSRATFVFETYRDLCRRLAGVADLAAVHLTDRASVSIGRGADQHDVGAVRVALVSGNYFSVVGARVAPGRPFTDADAQAPGSDAIAIVSSEFWTQRGGDAASALGQTLTIGSTRYTIVGVAAPAFRGDWVGHPADLWIPITMQSDVMPEQRGLLTDPQAPPWVRIIGRIHSGIARADAERAGNAAFRLWIEDTFSQRARDRMGNVRLALKSAMRGYAPERAILRQPLIVLTSLGAIVLLIACANAANVLLAMADSRRREIATWIAIGATPLRVARRLLTESALVSAGAGALGFLVASAGTHVIQSFIAGGSLAVEFDPTPSGRAFAFTAVLCALTGVGCGIVPAVRSARIDLARALKDGGRGSSSAWARRSGQLLLTFQVSLALVLVIAAGLFGRTVLALRATDSGVDRGRVLLARTAPAQAGYLGDSLARFYETARARLAAIPGVTGASVIHGGVPPTGYLSGRFLDNAVVSVGGQTIPPGAERRAIWFAAMPGFFDAMGMRLVSGRDIGPDDVQGTPPVAVVNEAFARALFGRANPIGKRFGFQVQSEMEIIGVVRADHFISPRDTSPLLVFLPYRQDPSFRFAHSDAMFAVHTAGDPRVIADRVRSELLTLDRQIPIVRIATADEELSRALAEDRLIEACAVALGTLAVVLGCIGIYSVLSYTVARRTGEFGIRAALGATPALVVAMVIEEAARPMLVGAAFGGVLALCAGQLVEAHLYGVTAHDGATFAAACVLMLVTGAAAAALPALRAARLRPSHALRAE